MCSLSRVRGAHNRGSNVESQRRTRFFVEILHWTDAALCCASSGGYATERPAEGPARHAEFSMAERGWSALSFALSTSLVAVSRTSSSFIIPFDLTQPAGPLRASSLFATPGTLLTSCVASVPQEATVQCRTSCASIVAGIAWAEWSSWARRLRSSLIASVAG